VKRLVAVILILLFAANVSGTAISYHFCGKMLQYFSFNGQKKKSKCCCGGGQEKKGCCKTKHCKVTIDESKSFAKYIFIAADPFTDAAILSEPVRFIVRDIPVYNVEHKIPPAHAPPLIRTVPLHILYQQFLI
jgi:hypothetical protein